MDEQLYLFCDSQTDRLERDIKKMKESYDKVRKSQYAKIGELRKLYDDARHEIEILKAAICRQQKIENNNLLF